MDKIRQKLSKDLKSLEDEYRKIHGDKWKDYYAAALEARLLAALKSYDDLLEREHGDGRSI